MSNTAPILFMHRVRCSVLIPEPNESLRKAGASPSECGLSAEYRRTVTVAGFKTHVYECEKHHRQIDLAFVNRRLRHKSSKKGAVK